MREEEERECKRKVIDAKAFQRFGKATIGCVQSEGKGRKTLPTSTHGGVAELLVYRKSTTLLQTFKQPRRIVSYRQKRARAGCAFNTLQSKLLLQMVA